MTFDLTHLVMFAVGILLGCAIGYAMTRKQTVAAPAALPDTISPNLMSMQSSLQKALSDQMLKISELEKNRAVEQQEFRTLMDLLRQEAGQLNRALSKPQARGAWGEVVLKRVLELSGLIEEQHYTAQVSLGAAQDQMRPDVVVYLPGKLSVIIDSKVPLTAFLEAQNENASEAEKILCIQRHAQQLKTHIQDLSSKAYWDRLKSLSPEFVVLFVPDEGMLSSALRADPTLFELAARARVMLASPMILIPLLRTVAFGWRQEDVSENARQIADLGKRLYESVRVFSEHYEKLGKQLNSSVDAYNKSLGSLETNFLSTASKLKDMKVVDHMTKPIADIAPIDIAARAPSKPELLQRVGSND
jgi:DNA recombination protein RmuC